MRPFANLLAAAAMIAFASSMRATPAVEPAPSTLTSDDWFVIEAAREGSPPATIGVARFSARTRGRARLLESELVFAREGGLGGDVRVLAVEELEPGAASVSWREIESAGGRSIHAEWGSRDDALRVTEWGNGPTLREELGSDEGALLPHYLLELLRRGRMTSGSVPCFDPLSRSIERLEVATAYEHAPGDASTGARTVELLRVDGTLARRYRFEGTRLAGFQLQEGGPWARAVDEDEHARARAALTTAARVERASAERASTR